MLGYQVYRLYVRLYKLVRWWRQCARAHLHQVAADNNRLSSSRTSSATVSSRVAFAPFATRRFSPVCLYCFFVVISATPLQCQYAIVYVCVFCARVSVNTNLYYTRRGVRVRVCVLSLIFHTPFFLNSHTIVVIAYHSRGCFCKFVRAYCYVDGDDNSAKVNLFRTRIYNCAPTMLCCAMSSKKKLKSLLHFSIVVTRWK